MRQANTQRPHRSSGWLGRTPTPGAAALHAPLPIPRRLLSGRRKSMRPQGRRRWGTMPLLPPPRALLSGGPVHGDGSACRWSAVRSTRVGPDPLTRLPDLLPQGLRATGLCGCGGAARRQRLGWHTSGHSHTATDGRRGSARWRSRPVYRPINNSF